MVALTTANAITSIFAVFLIVVLPLNRDSVFFFLCMVFFFFLFLCVLKKKKKLSTMPADVHVLLFAFFFVSKLLVYSIQVYYDEMVSRELSGE